MKAGDRQDCVLMVDAVTHAATRALETAISDNGKGFAAGVGYVDSHRSQLREGRARMVANVRFDF